jgi:hypothetical protein
VISSLLPDYSGKPPRRRKKGEKSNFSIGYNCNKASLETFSLRDERLEESRDVLAQEIVEDLETALERIAKSPRAAAVSVDKLGQTFSTASALKQRLNPEMK